MPLSLDSKPGQQPTGAYLPYTAAVEQPAPDEHVIFDELSRTMQHITRTMASRYATRIDRYMLSRMASSWGRSRLRLACRSRWRRDCSRRVDRIL